MTPPELSILTAVKDPNAEFITDAYNSLLTQDTTNWEWVIQIDGPGTIPKHITQDPRINLDTNPTPIGVAAARNRALMRVQSPHVLNLDGDDYLLPDALTPLTKLLTHPGIAAVGGVPEGTPAPGHRYTPGQLFDTWIHHYYEQRLGLPIHPAGLMWRTNILRAYGGWRALTGSEDTALLMAVSEDYTILEAPNNTFHYRTWPGQITASDQFQTNKAAHWDFVRASIQTQRTLHTQDAA